MDAYIKTISNNPELLLNSSCRYYECYDEEWLHQRGLHWAESASELEPSFRAFALRALYAKRLDEAEKFTELKSLDLGKATSEERETKLFEALAGNIGVSE